MKKYLAFPLALIVFASCDWTTKEPKVEKDEIFFDYMGGEQTVRIDIKNKNPWQFDGIISEYDKIINPNELVIDTLSDGTIKVDYEWADFYIAKDMSAVKVQVDENPNHKEREMKFLGRSPITGTSFWVKQKGNPNK